MDDKHTMEQMKETGMKQQCERSGDQSDFPHLQHASQTWKQFYQEIRRITSN